MKIPKRTEDELTVWRSCLLAALLPCVVCLLIGYVGLQVKRTAQQDSWENDSPAEAGDGWDLTDEEWEWILMSEDDWWASYFAGLDDFVPIDSDLDGAPNPMDDPINP